MSFSLPVTRRLAAAVGGTALAASLLVALPAGSAWAATESCLYKHDVSSTYAAAYNYGYGGDGRCTYVQAKARIWYSSSISVLYQSALDPYTARVDRNSGYFMEEQGTRAQPRSCYSAWQTAQGRFNWTAKC